ncbi:nuclear transport factor 2 family protein [Halieaceae bacterium IMCC14734]|uniref:Nuclear transport factor 2 family protein n=1 Tax=Candidatus Litorirhabdus singularis TaxID=2518993 RepID=A0ABT3TKT2_9GAMM|nr:nuclear transport factor 2 family protein [Candidatus Litorirhabdus singularis]MCX2982845.1 nuclear transport factor 2 family protein [Candidatus Litorirhabdus singularis]
MSLSVEEKLAIHELLSRAAYAYDERDTAMLENCFSVSAGFSMRIAKGDLVGPFEGRDAIMGLMTGSMAEQTDVRRHVVSNIFFDDSGEQLLAISNLTLMATENGDINLLSAGVYKDTVVNENGDWRIVNRHLELDKAY